MLAKPILMPATFSLALLLALALVPTAESGASHRYVGPLTTVSLQAGPGCLDVQPHHTSTITVIDRFFGGAVGFTVVTDWARTGMDDTSPCGDGVIEPCDPADPSDIPDVTCNARDGRLEVPPAPPGSSSNVVTVPFSTGADGMYHVNVDGALGDVF